MNKDAAIEEIRDTRRTISRECGGDLARFGTHLAELNRRFFAEIGKTPLYLRTQGTDDAPSTRVAEEPPVGTHRD